jgi:hypothetical protein
MPDGVGEYCFFLGEDYACVIRSGLSEEASLRNRNGTFDLVIAKSADKDGVGFDKAFGDDLVKQRYGFSQVMSNAGVGGDRALRGVVLGDGGDVGR